MAKNFIDKDMGMQEFLRQARKMQGKSYTKIGLPMELEPAIIQTDKPKKGDKSHLELVRIGAVHEFGAPNRNIPERSFLRSTVDKEKSNIDKLLHANLKAHKKFWGYISFKNTLAQVGEYVTNKVQNTIRNKIPPDLSEETLKRKTVQGKVGDVPLIDTGQLIQSISHVEVISSVDKAKLTK